MTKPNKFQDVIKLTITTDYVSNWGVWEAVREIIQNSIDQQVQAPKTRITFSHIQGEHRLIIGTDVGKLQRKSLLLGYSTKRGDTRTIGQHGEGYKLAFLVLHRMNFNIRVRTHDEEWTPFIQYDKAMDADMLYIGINKLKNPVNGTVFEIFGVGEEDYREIQANYLFANSAHPKEAENQILRERHQAGRVYINGLFVCEMKDWRYGYNLRPNTISVDRDRMVISPWNLQYVVARIWAKEKESANEEVYNNLKQDIPDFKEFSGNSRQQEYIGNRFQEQHKNTVPVVDQAQAEEYEGTNIAVTPRAMSAIVHSVKTFPKKTVGSPYDQMEEWLDRNMDLFRGDGDKISEFKKLLNASKNWQLKPGVA